MLRGSHALDSFRIYDTQTLRVYMSKTCLGYNYFIIHMIVLESRILPTDVSSEGISTYRHEVSEYQVE